MASVISSVLSGFVGGTISLKTDMLAKRGAVLITVADLRVVS